MADNFTFKSNKEAIERLTDDAVSRILMMCGEVAEGHAKKYCPVDTGNLRNSITYETDTDGKAMYVGTNVEYAESVELNEKAHHAVGEAHYLKNSIARHTDEYRKIMELQLKTI